MIIGIIGAGFCGNATKLFKCSEIDIMVYDIIPTKYPKIVLIPPNKKNLIILSLFILINKFFINFMY